MFAEILDLQLAGEFDVVTNTLPRSSPIGLSAEIVTITKFRNAVEKPNDNAEREYLKRYTYGHPEKFGIKNITASFSLGPSASRVVDRMSDYRRAGWMVDQAGCVVA